MQARFKRYIVKIIKVGVWITSIILILLLLISFAIQIPSVQNRIVQKVINELKQKLNTDVSVGSINIQFPKTIVIKDFYLEDQNKDTLLYAGNLSIDTDLWALTKQRIQINKVTIQSLRGYVSRSERDRVFNFDFIIDSFSKKDTEVKKDSIPSSWTFALKEASVENARLQFYDSVTGDFISGQWRNVKATLDEFDLSNAVIKFDEVSISNLIAQITQTKKPVSSNLPGDTTESPFDFDINDLVLHQTEANYENTWSGEHIRLDLGDLKMKANNIDLKKQMVDLAKVNIENTFVSYHLYKNTPSDSIQNKTPIELKNTWQIKLDEFSLSGLGVQYYDFTKPTQSHAVDFNHVWISQLDVEMKDMISNGFLVKSKIEHISFFEKSGFSVGGFKTELKLTEHDLLLHNLFMATGNSRIHFDGAANFASLQTIVQDYANANIQLKIDSSFLSFQDLLYFSPHILNNLPVHVPAKTILALHTQLQGKVNHITINNLFVKTLDHSRLSMHGVVDGLPRVDNMKMNIFLNEFYTTHADVRKLFGDSLLEASIKFPEWLSIKGNYKGTLLEGTMQSLLTSNAGAITLHADVNFDSTSINQGYKGEIRLDSIDLGHLVAKTNSFGKVTLLAKAHGKGWNMRNLIAQINLDVKSFIYSGYDYRNVELNGAMKSYFFEGSIRSQDKNFDFNVVGNLNYNRDIPHYHLTAVLANMDLQALHLTKQTLKARGTLSVDLATKDFKSINGNLTIRNVAIFNGSSLYKVDSLLVASIDQEGQTNIHVRSDLLNGSFTGTVNLFDLPSTLRHHFDTYFSLQDSTISKDLKPQDFKFDLELKKTELLTDIIFPELTSFAPGVIQGNFNSLQKKLNVNVTVNRILYNGIQIDSGSFRLQSDRKSLSYKVTIHNFSTTAFQVPSLSWTGIVASDSLKTKLEILDSLSKQKYILGGVFYSYNNEFQFRFLQGQSVLDYDAWKIPNDNYIRFNKNKIVIRNLILTNKDQVIFFKTSAANDSTWSVGFRHFGIEHVTSLISRSKTLMDGTLDGNIHFLRHGGINASLKLNAMSILKQPWGNLALQASHASSGKTTFTLTMKGDNGNINANGYYTATPVSNESSFSTIMSISKLNIHILEPLAFGQLADMKGMMNGDLNFTGSIAQPKIRGSLNFSDARVRSSYLNTQFVLKNETIQFVEEGIRFNNFNVLDASNNSARFNGIVQTSTYTSFRFNLDITARAFQLLNTTEEQNDLFYGKVNVNTRIKLTGTADNPIVNMNLSLTDGSTFTYIVPQSSKGVLEQKGIVEFVDRDAVKDPFLSGIKLTDTIRNKFVGVDLTANIELTNKASFTIIIDPVAGDKLAVQGDANLAFQMDPSGDMKLSGRYEIAKGSYNLSFYKLVKREFSIDKGSTIIWYGDPLNARMDIHAIYNVETSPLELLVNQLNSSNSQELNQYKQRLPFQVFLNIKGELLTPDITFKLGMPFDKRNAFGGNVYARIQDINTRESDLNRQVFALLLLKRFMADNPLENQGGSTLAGDARRSVSRLLTEQLNQLSSNIKGINLNFDLKSDEDYSTGAAAGNTKLQVGVSQKLFNDRLVVKVAGNVNIEGENSSQAAFTDYLGDLALEFKVTNDGRLRLTGFRNSNYDMIDGELIQTGAGLIYIKEYNFLKELFKADAKDK